MHGHCSAISGSRFAEHEAVGDAGSPPRQSRRALLPARLTAWTGCGWGCCWHPVAGSAERSFCLQGFVAQMTIASPVHPAYGLGYQIGAGRRRRPCCWQLPPDAVWPSRPGLDGWCSGWERAFHPGGSTSCLCPRSLARPTVGRTDSSDSILMPMHEARCDNRVDMAEARTIVTAASLALALVCAGWAIYEFKHQAAPGGSTGQQGRPGGGAGAGAPAGNRPGGGGAGGGESIPVLTATAERRQINVGIEAIGTANANESVNITSQDQQHRHGHPLQRWRSA